MKRLAAGILTLLIMSLLFWAGLGEAPRQTGLDGLGRPIGGAPETSRPDAYSGPTPEGRVRELLDKAREGDIDGYIACFAGEFQRRLNVQIGNDGRERFRNELIGAAGMRKSHAVFAAEFEGTDAASLVVESVYVDRNERQTYQLQKFADGWKVIDVARVKARAPAEKYGAPATYQSPEAPPVSKDTVIPEPESPR